MKKIVLLIMTVVSVAVLSACATTIDIDNDPKDIFLSLTIEELAEYDGTNGNPAYIAVDGVIYDVTDVPEWNNGTHNGYLAGLDLTDEIETLSPHGTSVLDDLDIVGELVDAQDPVIEDPPVEDTIYLTIKELEQYNGSGSNKAYISVNGIIYDVTDEADWANGTHNGLTAGNDLTVEIESSPHGTAVLEGLVAVGELVISHDGDGPYEPYLYLTLLELSQFNGADGNDAYIAVDNVIYDVTNSSKWNNGTHNGYGAGEDLTAEINSISPHGTSVLAGLVIVGEIVEN